MHSQRIFAPLFGLAPLVTLGLAAAPQAQAQQTLYVANQTGNILKFTPQGNASVLTNNLSNPRGLVFSSDGTLYVADTNNFRIVKVSSAGVITVVSDSAQGENSPVGLAFDSAGTLYASNSNTSRIVKVASDGSTMQFGPSVGNPEGIVFDGAGNLLVSTDGGVIDKITPGGTLSMFASNVGGPNGLAFDKAGNLYVAEYNTNQIEKFDTGGGRSIFASTGLNGPTGIAFDSAGNLFAANRGDNTIEKFTPAGAASQFANSSSGLSLPTYLTFGPVAAPEPSQFAGLGLGALGLGGLMLRVRRRKTMGV